MTGSFFMRDAFAALALLLFLAIMSGSQQPSSPITPAAAGPTFTKQPEVVRPVLPASVVELRNKDRHGEIKPVGSSIAVAPHILLTNHHVAALGNVSGFIAGELVETEPVADDHTRDLALLRVEAELTPVPLAHSRPCVGDPVWALGSPYGYSNTLTRGIVSQYGREIDMPSGDTLRDLIQTDAAINPGNSGGPLLNALGECVGINVALREGAHGIAFAIPADQIKAFLQRHGIGHDR
jgi:S1-C subfamily serine protease